MKNRVSCASEDFEIVAKPVKFSTHIHTLRCLYACTTELNTVTDLHGVAFAARLSVGAFLY